MYSKQIPLALAQFCSVALMYSGPLSQRMTWGLPRHCMICSQTRITRSEGNEKSTSMRGNQQQDHGMLQPTSDGKAVWRATVTSTTGWSHLFTLLRLAPALIWESGERPAPFAGGCPHTTQRQQAQPMGWRSRV